MKKLIAAILAVAMICTFGGFAVFANEVTPDIQIGVPQTDNSQQEVIDYAKSLDFTSGTVRYAAYVLGLSNLLTDLDPELGYDETTGDTYAFTEMPDDMLMDKLADKGISDMDGFFNYADPYRAYVPAQINILETNNSAKITVSSMSGVNTFKVSGDTGATIGTWDYNNGDIVITAANGYEITSAVLTAGMAYKWNDTSNYDGSSQPSDLISQGKLKATDNLLNDEFNLYDKSAHKLTLSKNDLTRKFNNQWSNGQIAFAAQSQSAGTGWGSKPSYGAFSISVSAMPIQVAHVSISDIGTPVDGALTYNGTSYNNATELATAINAAIDKGQILVGDTVTVNVSSDVAAVSVKDSGTTTGNKFSFKASSDEVKIAIVYAPTESNGVTISDSLESAKTDSSFFNEYVKTVDVIVNGSENEFSTFDGFNNFLKKQVPGTVVTLRFSFNNFGYIKSAEGGTPASNGTELRNVTLIGKTFKSEGSNWSDNYTAQWENEETKLTLKLTMATTAPSVTLSGYNSGNDALIVAEAELPDGATWNGATMTLTGEINSAGDNPNANEYIGALPTKSDSITDTYPYLGYMFSPKKETIKFKYGIRVNAYVQTSGGTASLTKNFEVSSSGASEQD